jgi:Zn ribbon nucleic-acid-binding protein
VGLCSSVATNRDGVVVRPISACTVRSSGRELNNGNNHNLDCRGSVTCGFGRNIFLCSAKEAAQKIRTNFPLRLSGELISIKGQKPKPGLSCQMALDDHGLLSCPSCGRPMVHVRRIWRWPGENIDVFHCAACGVSVSRDPPNRHTPRTVCHSACKNWTPIGGQIWALTQSR